MSFKAYIKQQILYIRKYATHIHKDAETAARLWVDHGHAAHYADLYR